MNFNTFRKSILKVDDKRNHNVNHSLGVYDAYKWIRKNKWLNIGKPLTEHQFYTIIRKINNYYCDLLLSGLDIKLPCNMGKLEIRKYPTKVDIKNGKIVTNLPIDWDRTLKLWYEDKEALKNRTLVKMDEKEIFKVYYNSSKAEYNNKSFYKFDVNRDLKLRLKQKIKDGTIDAFKIYE